MTDSVPQFDPETLLDSTEIKGDEKRNWKPLVFAVLAIGMAVLAFYLRDSLSLASLADREAQLRAFQAEHPVAVYSVAFVIYVLITGLSLPGAAALTLVYGWYFGLGRAVVLVSFASTSGASLAFLSSRYLLRESVQSYYGDAMRTFQERLRDEGPFYLFTLRLIPAVPFVVINLVMGLTPISLKRFWWVSQIGMLPGTVVYVFAGSRVPDLSVLADQGAEAVFQPSQLWQLAVAFSLLGIFPLAVKWTLGRLRQGKRTPD